MKAAYLVALLSSVAYGTADLAGGLAARRGPAMPVALVTSLAAILVMVVALPFVPGAPGRGDLLWGAAAGGFSVAGTTLIFKALALGPMSLASPVLCVVGLSVPVMAGVALGERPAPLAWSGVALAVLAIPALAATGRHETAPPREQVRRTVAVAVAGGLAAGCFLICVARIGPGAGLVPLTVARLVAILLFLAIFAARRRPLLPPPAARPLAAFAGVADSAANVAYWFAATRAPMSLAAPLVSLAPATTVLLARVLLGERWTGWQKAGLLLALAAAVMISSG